MAAVSINHLVKSFGDRFSLSLPTLEIDHGCIFGIVGPNGAGKTTTICILSTILRPDKGEVKILGFDPWEDPVIVKKNLGVLPEGSGLFDQLRGIEHLHFIGRVYGLTKHETVARTEELLEVLDLREIASKFVHTYSHGSRKKLAFAAAIMHRPRLLLLDEPFEGVDPLSSKVMKSITKAMSETGSTVVITSHNLDTIEELCHVVAVIDKGRIVFHSKTTDFLKKERSDAGRGTYPSLEDLFLEIVGKSRRAEEANLSWL